MKCGEKEAVSELMAVEHQQLALSTIDAIYSALSVIRQFAEAAGGDTYECFYR
jgi:hypothetical protein